MKLRALRKDSRAVTIVEMMLTMTITIVIFVIVQALLSRTIESWWRVNANADAQQQLYRVQNLLERDLASAAYERSLDRETIKIQKAPDTPAHLSGCDGDVLWFLSATDPVSGKFQRLAGGRPFWQRNILYYAVTPNGLENFDYRSTGLNVAGYESACPFKVMIRKEIDFGTATTPSSPESDMEALMTYDEISNFLNRPEGYTAAGMSVSGESVRPVAGNILTFRADFVHQLQGVSLDVRATAIERARREDGIGNNDLSTSAATQKIQVLLFPPNKQGDSSTSSAS